MNVLGTLFLTLAAPLGVFATQGEAPQRAWARGTKVELIPPATWQAASTFPGYFHKESRSSVMVTEVPGPFEKVKLGFTDKGELKKQGMTLLSTEDRKQGEHEGVLVMLSQSTPNVTVNKVVWLFGTAKETVIVMGTVVAQHKDEWLKTTETCVRSSLWHPDRKLDPFEGLSFKLNDLQGLQLVTRFGDTLSFTEDGKADTDNTGKLLYSIGPALNSGEIVDREAFVTQRIRSFPFEVLEVESKAELEVDGLEGYEVILRTSVKEQERAAYVVILFEDENYWIAFGEVKAEGREPALEKFSKITRSFKRIAASGPTGK